MIIYKLSVLVLFCIKLADANLDLDVFNISGLRNNFKRLVFFLSNIVAIFNVLLSRALDGLTPKSCAVQKPLRNYNIFNRNFM